eukprot:1026726-Alexandrium_andersonii.AAC.1
MRDSSNNTLHLVARVLIDSICTDVSVFILHCSRAVRRWRGAVASKMRSPPERLAVYMQLSMGGPGSAWEAGFGDLGAISE